MRTATTYCRWLGLLLVTACIAGTAYGQNRTVTLTLNSATIPDTTREDSFMEVRGAGNGISPFTLVDGNMIDWGDVSTIEPVNVGGDYWQVTFDVADTTDLVFKFYSQQAEDARLNGWEADPNPNIPAGTGDTTNTGVPLSTVHFFESQSSYRGVSGDRGDYDWRPYEQKQDSIAIWFRVYMQTGDALSQGYEPTDFETRVQVRGGPPAPDAPDEWGDRPLIDLEREADDIGATAYRLFSGAIYYPLSAVGETQEYKFTFEQPDGTVGWEGSVGEDGADNRTFVVPAQDSTLRWVYFSNSRPADATVESAVIFSVDMSPLEDIGIFDIARGDTLEVRGDFNGWDCDNPDDCLLLRAPGESVFEQAISLTAVPQATPNFKFFLNLNDSPFREQFGGVEVIPSGWEEPISTQGANRQFTFEGIPDGFQELPVFRFNDILPGNIIPEGTSVDINLSVDMTAAAANQSDPFVPGEDSVTIDIKEPFFSLTQGFPLTPRDDDPTLGDALNLSEYVKIFQLTDDDGDMVYTGTLTINGPTYGALQYVYAYGGGGSFVTEPEGSTSGAGRRRMRFVAPNEDGTWPATWDFPQETFLPEGGPFTDAAEPNPVATGVEAIDAEVPSEIWLGANYPNPFNPSTTFEYSIDRTQNVKVRIYDMLGRLVATLVDGTQPPATYQVTFDAARLASGVYIYRLEAGSQVLTKRMLLIK